jgi:hypothetical protein
MTASIFKKQERNGTVFNGLPPSSQNQNSMTFELEDGRVVKITAKNLTPDEAKELLSLNTRNRSLNAQSVNQIANDITEGEWKFTGDTIKIAVDREGIRFVADAQHRLEGIAKSGLSVPVLIVENLDPDVTDLIDQLRTRQVGDILRMTYGHRGLKNDSIIAGIANLMIIGSNEEYQGKRPTRKEQADWAHQRIEKLHSWAIWAKSVAGETDKVQAGPHNTCSAMAPAPLAAIAIHMVDSGANHELVTEFFTRLATGLVSDSDKSNVIPALRKRQKNGNPLGRVGGGGAMTGLFTEFASYILAYNKWVIGEQVSLIKGQKHPIRFLSDLPQVSKFGN